MAFEGLILNRLTADYAIKSFDCDDTDLNDFLKNDAIQYQQQLLAVTYLLESQNETIAFFSVFNDKISIEDVDTKSKWKSILRLTPHQKRLKSFPAMKIGRLAVNKDYKNRNYGTSIIDYVKELFITNNRTGCKFITVDAYRKSLVFYEKNGFKYLTNTDSESDTRLMYYDLVSLLK
ncbi:MAG: GNAT family N-acetyltransferase [Bacteroidota bacterium]|nr:GNAT family N-acetyltransferase [Bacteroidota bacterium]